MMVFIFCSLLILGIWAGQAFEFSFVKGPLALAASVCLAYIMIEVGLEFSADKIKIRSYGWDAAVAFIAAMLPALLWSVYFVTVVRSPWQPSLLSGLSSAPTSAGVLFAMMMAAGLGKTWVFSKARTLAVLDDLATILLLMPLQVMIYGLEWKTFAVFAAIGLFLFASFRWQSAILWPADKPWILGYAFVLSAAVLFLENTARIHLGVLIPAFGWGCLMHLPKNHPDTLGKDPLHLDTLIKGAFMFLVGASFPKISMASVPFNLTLGHVLVLTLLANLGKCFPVLCYRKQVPVRQRLALSVAMFPRGEVGAAVLLIGFGYGLSGYANTLAMLSLAFNLILTGLFIWIVTRLSNAQYE